eukprot:TRINITY_DN5389_c0_g1_i1.p1 TRINITY_DN5389_c0_g1~~TRINITY_DN5389_c0_g1_i1.p1  ORF type:complete len:313 (+),score=87.96 TRINITY_DN5389_c0_g1_i1:109-1047(+)
MGEGDADQLLDRILRNALGEGSANAGSQVKQEGVKNEPGVKKEGVKSEPKIKTEIKGEVKGEKVKGEKVKSEIKGEIKGEAGIKSEIKKETTIKREPAADAYALKVIDEKDKKRQKKRSRSRRKKSKSRKRRRRRSSSSDSSKSAVGQAMAGLPQARVVAVRGHWAQYLSPAGETFYKNVLSGEVQWQKPGNFDCQPSRRAGEMTPAPGEAACYIFHMPPEWSEADLMQLFAPFGQVTSAHVQRDANGFSRSCGFVTYAHQDHANEACNMMNGFGVDGKYLKVSLTQFSLGTTGATAPGPGPGGAPGMPALK